MKTFSIGSVKHFSLGVSNAKSYKINKKDYLVDDGLGKYEKYDRNLFLMENFGITESFMSYEITRENPGSIWGPSFGNVERTRDVNPFYYFPSKRSIGKATSDKLNPFVAGMIDKGKFKNVESANKVLGHTLGFVSIGNKEAHYAIGKLRYVEESAMENKYFLEGVAWTEDHGTLTIYVGQIIIINTYGSHLKGIYEIKDSSLPNKIAKWAKDKGRLDNSDYRIKSPLTWYTDRPKSTKQSESEFLNIVPKGIIVYVYLGLNADQVKIIAVDNGRSIETKKIPIRDVSRVSEVINGLRKIYPNYDVYNATNYEYSVFQSKWYKSDEPLFNIPNSSNLYDWEGFKGVDLTSKKLKKFSIKSSYNEK